MVGIVFLLDLEYAPYLIKYTSQLERLGINYEIITWSRLNNKNNLDKKIIQYTKEGKLQDRKFKKLLGLIGYRKFLIDTLKNKKYDKLIILTTLTGIIISDYLIKNYKDRFIFDIRDYTFEKIKLYKKIEKNIVEASAFTAISSTAFKEFLPISNKYIITHNILYHEINEAKNRELYLNNKSKEKINLTFIGSVRHFDLDKKVINSISSDNRFRLIYHGYGASYDLLNRYCEENKKNVLLTGKYDRKDKLKLMKNVDIINSYYDDNNIANKYALPNKYYDALIYKVPIWANPNVYVGKRAIEKGIGINVKLDENTSNNILNQYNEIDWNEFYKNCDAELNSVLDEDNIFNNKLNQFILK